MYHVTVILRKLSCVDTESIHSSDKFALSGTLLSDTDEPTGIYLPTIRINDGEVREIDREYSIWTDSPSVGISLVAWDIDEGDSWKESESDIKTGVDAVAAAAKLIPGYGTVVSAVIAGASKAVIGAINIFNAWDKDDKLLEYNEAIALPIFSPHAQSSFTHKIRFHGSDPVGYSTWDYELEMEIRYAWLPAFPQTPSVGAGERAAQMFRQRAVLATAAGFVGAFPNFYVAQRGVGFVAGTIFVTASVAEWRDVALAELDDVDLDDFEGRMRATNAYASRQGFAGGFPTYHHADYGNGVVCGTVLLRSEGAEWRDVRLSELGNPALSDFEARFRATQDYGSRNDFVGGFPNLFHADKEERDFQTGRRTRYTVCGTVLLKSHFLDIGTGRRQRVAEWRDV